MLGTLLASFKEGLRGFAQRVQQVIKNWLTPQSQSPVTGAIGDALRSRSDLIVENALLRQQLIVLKRQIKRPQFTSWDRWLIVWLTSRWRSWRQIVLVQPDAVLRWHRELFRHFWSGKSRVLADWAVHGLAKLLGADRHNVDLYWLQPGLNVFSSLLRYASQQRIVLLLQTKITRSD